MSAAAAACSARRWRARAREVTAIDLAPELLKVAQTAPARIRGRRSTTALQSVEALAAELPGAFDAITCMEMLEHVPDPASIIARLRDAAQAGRPPVPVHAQPHAGRVRAGDRRRRIRRAPAAEGHASVPRFHQAVRTRRRGCARPACSSRTSAAWCTNPGATRARLIGRTDVNYLACALKPEAAMAMTHGAARCSRALVLFDLDGTLLDSAPDMLATVNRAARGARRRRR